MPVHRYHDISEVPDPPRADSPLAGLRAACAASTISDAFGARRQAPRGVRRFRSIEEADAHRRAWEEAGPEAADDGPVPN